MHSHSHRHHTLWGTPVVPSGRETPVAACLPTCLPVLVRTQGPEAGAAAGSQLGWGALLAPKYRRVMILAAGLPLFQQLSGINTVIFYSSEVRPALLPAENMNGFWTAVLACQQQ